MKAINVTTLLADTGHVLTQAADVEAAGQERFYTTEIILGCNDCVENYKEVPVSEVRGQMIPSTREQEEQEAGDVA